MTHGPHDNHGVTPGKLGPLAAVDLPRYGKTGGVVGRRPPILDDSHVQTVWNAADINWESVAEQRAQTIADQQGVIAALQSDLSDALFQRDIGWPLAFCVGVICGVGLVMLW